MTLHGVLELDGKKQHIDANKLAVTMSNGSGTASEAAMGGGVQVTETISLQGDKLVTSVTVRGGGRTTTTTTTTDTDDGTSTTTTTTTDENGNTTTDIKVNNK